MSSARPVSTYVASLLKEECQDNGIEPRRIEPASLREQLGEYYFNKEHSKVNECPEQYYYDYHKRQKDKAVAVKVRLSAAESGLALFALAAAPAAPAKAAAAPAGVASCERLVAPDRRTDTPSIEGSALRAFSTAVEEAFHGMHAATVSYAIGFGR
jgi:hypothetical protein